MSETRELPHIRTFHPRRGRMGPRHAEAFETLWPRFGLTVADGDRTPLDLPALFGRDAPVVLEIGFGMGDVTAAMAGDDPGRDYLAVEVHTPGIANLLGLIGARGLTNIRVAHGDALELVRRIGPGALDAVHVFFPDPWPKARHHKRRLIRGGNVALLRERLRPGGLLHCATDWPHYAEEMAETLAADPELIGEEQMPLYREKSGEEGGAAATRAGGPELTGGPERTGPGSERPQRPETKFERRGRDAGRPIADLRYVRQPAPPPPAPPTPSTPAPD